MVVRATQLLFTIGAKISECIANDIHQGTRITCSLKPYFIVPQCLNKIFPVYR